MRRSLSALIIRFGMLAVIPAAALAEDIKGSFELITGGDTPVCDAYVAKLNSMKFQTDPYCDRTFGFQDSVLASPDRAPLSGEEILRLYAPAMGFLRGARPSEKEAREVAQFSIRLLNQIGKPEYRAFYPSMFRFFPPVDIDNDGLTDDLVGWRQGLGACGTTSGPTPLHQRAPTFFLFLDSAGVPDDGRTRAAFGHPAGNELHLTGPGTDRPRTMTYTGFRGIGASFDVFRFRDEFFFNTFRDNLEGPSMEDNIAVMKRKDGRNALMCEIRWKHPPLDRAARRVPLSESEGSVLRAVVRLLPVTPSRNLIESLIKAGASQWVLRMEEV